jgi:uracil-DNA glycosylase
LNIKGIGKWNSLAYWRSGEWQVVRERLKNETQYNPQRADLFASLRLVHPESCRVMVMGQDPYPSREHCTGVAFSTSGEITPSLKNIFREYSDDLGYPPPKSGDLTRWCEQGVLLWNVYPSCLTGFPGSHHWEEWTYLTKEIVEKLDDGQVVFVTLGRVAHSFARFLTSSIVISTSHPSPLGAKYGFLGSKIFSRVNSSLERLGKEPIDWRLEDEEDRS